MTAQDKVKELAVEVKRLNDLLQKPEFGIMIWWQMVGDQMKEVKRLIDASGVK